MRCAIVISLALLALAAQGSAATNSIAVANGTNYTVEDQTYFFTVVNENATLLQTAGSGTILRKNDCRTLVYTRYCLKTISGQEATIEETFLGPVLTDQHTLLVTSVKLGGEVSGTVSLANTGEQPAKDVTITLAVPAGIAFDDGTQRFTWSGTVTNSVSIPYYLTGDANGSYTISGTVTYHDNNDTQTISLDNRTLSVTIPFTYKLAYRNETSFTDTSLSVNITKTTNDNYTFVITADFPPQAAIVSATDTATVSGASVREREKLNSTHKSFGLDVIYHFEEPPSRALFIDIEYSNDTERQTVTIELPYNVFEDEGAPSIAVAADPLVTNRTSSVSVVITGNRTGTLTITSGLLNYSGKASPGEQSFPVTPAASGNYTLSLVFETIGPYGESHEAAGAIELVVTDTAPAPAPSVNTTNSTAPTETVEEQQTAAAKSSLLIVAVAAVSLLIVLGLVLGSMRNPVRRAEALLAKIERLRAAHEHTPLAAHEVEQLAQLQAALEELQRKL